MKIPRALALLLGAVALALVAAAPAVAGEDDNHHRGSRGYGCHWCASVPASAPATSSNSSAPASSSSSPATSSSPVPSSSPSAPGSGDDVPTLPKTGVAVPVLIGAAVLLILLGRGAMRLGRRRRVA